MSDEPFTAYVGDLSHASELAGIDRPADLSEVPEWLAVLTGRDDDPVHVQLQVPLAPSAPAEMVEEDLGWSVLDVDRFLSWKSREVVTTVVAGSFDESTLGAVPEADGVHSAGEGADLAGGLEDATPARPQGHPMRMAARSGWLIASPYTEVAHAWEGDAASLADDRVLSGIADRLDRADAYAAWIATPTRFDPSSFPVVAAEALDMEPQSFPEFDVYAIGWSVSDGDGQVTVVYHDADGKDLAETQRLVAERWNGATFTGRPFTTLVAPGRVAIEGENVVVTLEPVNGYSPEIVGRIADNEDLPFLAR